MPTEQYSQRIANAERAQQIKERFPDNIISMNNRSPLWMSGVEQVSGSPKRKTHWSDYVWLVALGAACALVFAKAKGII